MSILETIVERKRLEVDERRRSVPLAGIRARVAEAPATAGFRDALDPGGGGREAAQDRAPRIIAEVKKASPSKGVIRPDFDPVGIARAYEAAGAAAVSVLTDEPFFQGRLEYLEAIRRATPLPLLRKDFVIDTYQVWESRAAGADAILLILAALGDDGLVRELAAQAGELGLDVLWEVHDEAELDRALVFGPRIVGINNRNLKTFEVTLETTRRLAGRVPAGVVRVSESGFFRHDQIERMRSWGVDAFLVGESLLRQEDAGAALKCLLGAQDPEGKEREACARRGSREEGKREGKA